MFLFFTFCLIVWGKRNNDRYKQVQTKYKWPAVLIFILFDKIERRVHIGPFRVYYNNFQSVQRFDEKKELSKFNFELFSCKSRICLFREIQIIDIFSCDFVVGIYYSFRIVPISLSLSILLHLAAARRLRSSNETIFLFNTTRLSIAAKALRNPPRGGEEKSSQAARNSTR